MLLNDKIIQIMPAPQGLLGVYTDDTDGTEFYTHVVCLALTEEGDVLMLDTDDFGEIGLLAGNKGIKWVGDTE